MFTSDQPANLPVRLQDDDGRWYWMWDPPEVELIDGVQIRKVSPKRRHARIQGTLFGIVDQWGLACGYEAGTEWRFHLSGDDSYVADIAAVSVARLEPLSDEEAEEPCFAPDLAIEVRSPSNRSAQIAIKIARYLDFGGALVLDVDPAACRIFAHDAAGATTYTPGEIFRHPRVPGLTFDVRKLFAAADRRKR